MRLTDYEIEVLRMMNGGPKLPWGAAMSAALEFLVGCGLATKGPHYRITEAGKSVLEARDG